MAKKSRSRKKSSSAYNCKTATSLIADYLTANLSAGTQAAFEDHLSQCGDCVAFLQTYRKTIEATQAFLRTQSIPRQSNLMPTPLSRGRR